VPSTFFLQTPTLTSAFAVPSNNDSSRKTPLHQRLPCNALYRLYLHRAMSDSTPSNPAATMPIKEGDQHCHLLDLPVEMLQRITNNLHRTQALPALRLTCKALDHVTFDRFAQTFGTVKCCIFYEKRWLSLKKLLETPSRITDKIRWVEFTTCSFESTDYHKLPLALNHDDGTLRHARATALKTYAKSQAAAIQDHSINVALLGRVLHDLIRVFPHINISCHISDNQGDGLEHLRAQRDFLFDHVGHPSQDPPVLSLPQHRLGAGQCHGPPASRAAAVCL
jgi:hypothetical protein